MVSLNKDLLLEKYPIRFNDLSFPNPECSARWIGHGHIESNAKIFWDRPSLGIVSSHLGANAFASTHWQTKLDAALRFAKQQGYRVHFANNTPYSLAIRTACASFQVPAIEFLLSSGDNTTIESARHSSEPMLRSHRSLVHATIEISQQSTLPEFRHLPIHDRVVVSLSRFLFAIEIRPRGKMAELIELRLNDLSFPKGSVLLGICNEANPSSIKPDSKLRAWLDNGVVGWLCHFTPNNTSGAVKPIAKCNSEPTTCVPIFPMSQWRPSADKYLIHCTRARRGPWPDQSIQQFHDSILASPWNGLPSAMDSLVRILEQQRIIATSSLKPGRSASVSFSACPLDALLSSRRFESHLGRWDWEPYGLMLSTEWLAQQGCQAVRYCSKTEMNAISKQNPDSKEGMDYLQVYSESGEGRDWRVEREWRITKDVRLSGLPFSQGIVFVPSLEEAHRISSLSRWPICVVN